MFGEHKVAVVVPAHNEAEFIGRVVGTMPIFVDRIYVVDDASTDGTGAAASTAGDPRTRILKHESNRGVGGAILSGYRAAIEDGTDFVAVMAGDGQMDPADLESLLGPLEQGEADYVKGNRLGWPGARQLMPWTRFVGNHVYSWLSRRLCGYPELRDSQCGYTAIRSSFFSRLDPSGIYPRYGFPNDLLSRLACLEARLIQVPVRPIYGNEKSGISLFTALVRMPLVLLSCHLRIRRFRRGQSLAARVTVPSLAQVDRS